MCTRPARRRVRTCRGSRADGRTARAVRYPRAAPRARASRRLAATVQEQSAPDPGHEIAPVVEVEMGDHDRVRRGPRRGLAQAAEHTGPAVEQGRALIALDEIARLGAARIRPGGRATDDGELQAGKFAGWAQPTRADVSGAAGSACIDCQVCRRSRSAMTRITISAKYGVSWTRNQKRRLSIGDQLAVGLGDRASPSAARDR